MKKTYNIIIFTIFLLNLFFQMAQAKCPNGYDEGQCYIYRQNNEFFVPEQWGFRSGYTLKENYLMDMKPKWEQTRDEWTNTYNPKPIQSNWKNAITDPVIYSNQFKVFRIPKSWINKF